MVPSRASSASVGVVLIEGGSVLNPSSGTEQQLDFLIEDGRIKATDTPNSFAAVKPHSRVDARGTLVTPGLIDLHVHLREPGFEWKETIRTGVEAAVLGGYTTVCCMPNTSPVNDRGEVTEFIARRAEAAQLAHVRPIGAISNGLKGRELSALTELRRAGCVAFSDDGEPVYDAGLMRRAIEWCADWGVTFSCHEEDKSLSCCGVMNESGLSARLGLPGWHSVAEEVMIARDIELARAFQARMHFCHVTTARGVELIRRAKHDGIAVTAEVTPHHLWLTEDAVEGYDTYAKMSPPLRGLDDVRALRRGLADGTIDAVASDHAPHELDMKRVEFGRAAFGILGLQTSLPLLLELVERGELSLARAVDACTAGAARCFGLTDCGSLHVGARADIALIDRARRWEFSLQNNHSKSVNSPFLGRKLTGVARTVLVGGRVVVRDEQLAEVAEEGS